MNAARNSTDQEFTNTVSVADALWLHRPEIVEEVQQLRQRFSIKNLCIADVLCDKHPSDAMAFLIVDNELNTQRLTFGQLRSEERRAGKESRCSRGGRGR